MTAKDKIKEKRELKQLAIDQLAQRIVNAESAMKNAQNSANEEDKSSAGDKYETARAMGQLEADMNAKQLEEARKDLSHIEKINVNLQLETVAEGAVVHTDKQKFFISIGLATVQYKKNPVIFISLSSPLGKAFDARRINDEINFNSKTYRITDIY